jgi:hypothetical protein
MQAAPLPIGGNCPVALYFFLANPKVNKRASARTTAKVSALGAVMQPAGYLRRACGPTTENCRGFSPFALLLPPPRLRRILHRSRSRCGPLLPKEHEFHRREGERKKRKTGERAPTDAAVKWSAKFKLRYARSVPAQ